MMIDFPLKGMQLLQMLDLSAFISSEANSCPLARCSLADKDGHIMGMPWEYHGMP